MKATNFHQLSVRIQQTFLSEHKQLALRLILSLEDISLHNFTFVDLVQDFAPTAEGLSKNVILLQSLNSRELQLVELFLKEVQSTCPTCFATQVKTGLASIEQLLSKSLVS